MNAHLQEMIMTWGLRSECTLVALIVVVADNHSSAKERMHTGSVDSSSGG